MLRVVSGGLWAEIKKLGKNSKTKAGAIAYVTTDAPVKFKRGDILVCDASDNAIASGQTSARVLRAAHKRGAKLYSSPGLHSKVLVFGRVAVVGSANMSDASASTLTEAAIITDDARAIAGVRAFIEELVDGADAIDAAFLARIGKIKVRAPRRGSKRRRALTVRGPRAWLISVVPLDDQKYEAENDVVEREREAAEEETEFSDSDTGYLRFTGSSRFRKFAKRGDLVISICLPHAKSKRGKVYAPEPLLHRKDKGKVTHFFVEEYSDREKTALPFSRFTALWKRAGAGRAPTLNTVREVSVDAVETLRQIESSLRLPEKTSLMT